MADKFVLTTDPAQKDKFYAYSIDWEGDNVAETPSLENCDIRQLRFGAHRHELSPIKDPNNFTVIEGGTKNGRYGKIITLHKNAFTVVYTEIVPFADTLIEYKGEYVVFADYVRELQTAERRRRFRENMRSDCITFCSGKEDCDLLALYNAEHTVVLCETEKILIPQYLMKYFNSPNPILFETSSNIGHTPHQISAKYMKTVLDLLMLYTLRRCEDFFKLLKENEDKIDDCRYICQYFNIEILAEFLAKF